MTCRARCGPRWLPPCALWPTGQSRASRAVRLARETPTLLLFALLLLLTLVLEGEPELGPVGDLAILAEAQVLLDHLSHAQVPQRLTSSVHRVRRGVLPRLSTRPDEVGNPVHAHCILLIRPEPRLAASAARL